VRTLLSVAGGRHGNAVCCGELDGEMKRSRLGECGLGERDGKGESASSPDADRLGCGATDRAFGGASHTAELQQALRDAPLRLRSRSK